MKFKDVLEIHKKHDTTADGCIIVKMSGKVYSIAPENTSGDRGMHGALHHIKFLAGPFAGKTIRTTNLWLLGFEDEIANSSEYRANAMFYVSSTDQYVWYGEALKRLGSTCYRCSYCQIPFEAGETYYEFGNNKVCPDCLHKEEKVVSREEVEAFGGN